MTPASLKCIFIAASPERACATSAKPTCGPFDSPRQQVDSYSSCAYVSIKIRIPPIIRQMHMKWHIFGSSARGIHGEPWAEDRQPQPHDGSVFATDWTEIDWQRRRALIRRWDEAFKLGRMSSDDRQRPNEAGFAVDQSQAIVVEYLSETFAADRNFGWYEEELEPVQDTELDDLRRRADADFVRARANVRQAALQKQRVDLEIRSTPKSSALLRSAEYSRRNLFRAEDRMRAAKAQSYRARIACGWRGARLHVGIVDWNGELDRFADGRWRLHLLQSRSGLRSADDIIAAGAVAFEDSTPATHMLVE